MLITEGVPIGNVTFESGCRNNWHIHKADGALKSKLQTIKWVTDVLLTLAMLFLIGLVVSLSGFVAFIKRDFCIPSSVEVVKEDS